MFSRYPEISPPLFTIVTKTLILVLSLTVFTWTLDKMKLCMCDV